MVLLEYEMVAHEKVNGIKVYFNMMNARGMHAHEDIEAGTVIKGEMFMTVGSKVYKIKQGDIFITQRYVPHSFTSKQGVLAMGVQLSSELYRSTFPDLLSTSFIDIVPDTENTEEIRRTLFSCAFDYYDENYGHELICTSDAFMLLYMLTKLPHISITKARSDSAARTAARIDRISDMIYLHLAENITLSQIASSEHLSECYMSHFFSDTFGMSFREYIGEQRFLKALELSGTGMSLTDICMECGFSSTRYLNNMFEKHFGCSYRQYTHDKSDDYRNYDLPDGNIQHIFTKEEAVRELERIKKAGLF